MRPEKRRFILLSEQSSRFRVSWSRMVQVNRISKFWHDVQNRHVYGMFPAVGNVFGSKLATFRA